MPYPNLHICQAKIQPFLVVALAASVALLSCQAGSGQDRSDRGRRSERGGRSKADDSSSRIVKFVKRLDRNGNEILEPNEMVGGAANYLQSQGFDTSQPISLNRVIRKFAKGSEKNPTEASSSSKVIRKVPGFGVELEPGNVPGFVGNDSVVMDSVSMEAKYGRRVMELVERTLEGYDKNKNSALDPLEIKAARWGTPPPEASDTNKDGTISKIELAERYLARDRDANRSRDIGNGRRRPATANSFQARTSPSAKPGINPAKVTRSSSPRGRSKAKVTPSRTYSKRSAPRATVSSSSPAFNSGSDRYARYAKGLMTQYDQNKDGKLDKEEFGKMRRPPKNADVNRDGFVTPDELTTVLSGGAVNASNNNVTPATVSAAALKKTRDENNERLRRTRDSSKNQISNQTSNRNRGSFSGLDTNADGQVQMHEFSTEWDGDVLAEFQAKDTNGDGVITSNEWNGR